MSEMFTKIGGFIASGEPLVYGDENTISGSGTLAEPFGVKTQQLFVQSPLYTGTSGEGSATSGYIGWRPDETVIYSGSTPVNTLHLSEEATNFERLRLELSSHQSPEIVNYTEIKPHASYLTYFANALIPAATYPLQIAGIQYTANNAKDYTMTTGVRMCYKVNETYGDQYSSIETTNIRDVGFITKIWGINRKPEA